MSDDPIGYPPVAPEAPVQTAPPPRRRGGVDTWPWWYGILTPLAGIFVAGFLSAILAVFWEVGGGDIDDPTFLVIASVIQDVVFVITAFAVARISGSVSMRDFGLVRQKFWPTIGKAALIIVTYFVLVAVYNQLVHLKADDAPDKLGADAGVLGMLGFALLVAVIAPIAEEVLFRGMMFRSFANAIGIVPGAIVSGLIFGAVHFDSLTTSRLQQVVPLALLGILFALLYAWSGTLYSTIGLHATNNALAVLVYASDHDSTFGVVLAVVLWSSMMIGCIFGYKLTDRGPEESEPVAAVAPPPPPSVPPPNGPPPPPSLPSPPPAAPRPDFPWGEP